LAILFLALPIPSFLEDEWLLEVVLERDFKLTCHVQGSRIQVLLLARSVETCLKVACLSIPKLVGNWLERERSLLRLCEQLYPFRNQITDERALDQMITATYFQL